MALNTLLEGIWGDSVVPVEDGNRTPMSLILNSLLAAPVVSFIDRTLTDPYASYVCYGGYEILPGASLADVLLEELGLEIDEATVVLVEPQSNLNAEWESADDLGKMVGRILVDLSAMESGDSLAVELPGGVFGSKPTMAQNRRSAVN